jgi:hypothetical protein
MMRCKKRLNLWIGMLLGVFVGGVNLSGVMAANIEDFIKISPFAEVETSFDNNVFELSDDAPLPENGKEREDTSFTGRAGLGLDITLDRPYLGLGVGLNYTLAYVKFLENEDLDNTQHNLDFNLNFKSNYEEGLLKDRLKFFITDGLALIPMDEEEPLYSGNITFRNDFTVGADYKLISMRRLSLTAGYAYGRVDYPQDDKIEVITISGYEATSDLTQEMQTHTGKSEAKYLLNPNLTCNLTYTYALSTRENNPGELVSADFTRQNILGGIQAKLTPRIQGNFQAGYAMTSYEDVGGLTQDDQNSFVAESSITANFAHQPLMTVGYRKYFIENDFGDTLLTDDVFARMGIKVVPGLLVNISGNYILEDRDLSDDRAVQKILGIESEYEVIKNMSLIARYNYRRKDFFVYNFLAREDREETSHNVAGGFQYKIGRHFLLNGLYAYTNKTSDVAEQAFTRNKFTATGKFIF